MVCNDDWSNDRFVKAGHQGSVLCPRGCGCKDIIPHLLAICADTANGRLQLMGRRQAEAVRMMIDNGSMEALVSPRWAYDQIMKFKAAFQNRRAEFPGMSRQGVRTLARNDLAEVIKPFAEFVARKLTQLKAWQQGLEEYDKLLGELRTVTDNAKEFE